jgi:hypothetical protein
MLSFVSMPEYKPGVRLWGAADERRTYMISFDEKHPEFAYRASWRNINALDTTHVPRQFETLFAAQAALERIHKRIAAKPPRRNG